MSKHDPARDQVAEEAERAMREHVANVHPDRLAEYDRMCALMDEAQVCTLQAINAECERAEKRCKRLERIERESLALLDEALGDIRVHCAVRMGWCCEPPPLSRTA